jgi:hypothetical protein
VDAQPTVPASNQCAHDNLYRVDGVWKCFRHGCDFSISSASETTDELTQLRRIDRAAREFVDAPAGDKTEAAFAELEQALYDGRPGQKTGCSE